MKMIGDMKIISNDNGHLTIKYARIKISNSANIVCTLTRF